MTQVLYKGVDWHRRITITEDGERKVQLRRRTGTAVLVELSVGAGITLLTQSGDTLGQADIVLPGASSAPLEKASHVVCALVDGRVALAPTKVVVGEL